MELVQVFSRIFHQKRTFDQLHAVHLREAARKYREGFWMAGVGNQNGSVGR